MADDPFQDLLELEDEFYKEGFEAGVADSAYAGMIEGKVFGIEKGYEKALELAKMHGRATVWDKRAAQSHASQTTEDFRHDASDRTRDSPSHPPLSSMQDQLGNLPSNNRIQKHIENLLALTDSTTTKTDNSDDSVSEFDDRLAKARAKAKIIANIVGEPLNPAATANAGIEDATGLNARH